MNQRGNPTSPLLTQMLDIISGLIYSSDLAGGLVERGETESETDNRIMSKKDKKLERMIRKSLLPSSGSNRAPVPHSIMIQSQILEDTGVGMKILDVENELMMLKLEVPQPVSQSELKQYEEQWRKVVEVLLEHGVTSEWSGTVTPEQMWELLKSEEFRAEVVVPNELKTWLAKKFILSLCDHCEDAMLFSRVSSTVFDFLVSHATNSDDTNLLQATTWILSHPSTKSEQLGPKVFSTLAEYLKTMREDQVRKEELTVLSILRLFEEKCKIYSTETIQILGKYLESGSHETGRIYSA